MGEVKKSHHKVDRILNVALMWRCIFALFYDWLFQARKVLWEIC